MYDYLKKQLMYWLKEIFYMFNFLLVVKTFFVCADPETNNKTLWVMSEGIVIILFYEVQTLYNTY